MANEDNLILEEECVELDGELFHQVKLMLHELIDKVANQERREMEEELEQVLQLQENAGAAAAAGAVIEEPAWGQEPKEIRDYNNNIIFPLPPQEYDDLDDLLLAQAQGGGAEFGIGDFVGAEETDKEKEEMQELLSGVKQDLLLLRSEFTESNHEQDDPEIGEIEEIYGLSEDLQAEQEMFDFRQALAKLDAESIASFIEIKPALAVDFLYSPPEEINSGIVSSTDEDEDVDTDTTGSGKAIEAATVGVNQTASASESIGSHRLHPFVPWIRQPISHQNEQGQRILYQDYGRSKSNSCCGETKPKKRIRFASQAQIIPSSSKYVSDEEDENANKGFLLFGTTCFSTIKGEGLALRNKASVDAEIANIDNEDDQNGIEEFVNGELILKASELSAKLSETIDQVLSTVESNHASDTWAYTDHNADEDAEYSHTESIECIADPDFDYEYDFNTVGRGYPCYSEEIESSDQEDVKSPVQRMSNSTFLDLYMTESQKSCGELTPGANENEGEYQLTEEEMRMIRDTGLLIDRAGNVLDEATKLLRTVGSATSIDDEFIHTEEWKEQEQASTEEPSDDESLQQGGSEYDSLYSHLTDKARAALKDKIDARNKFFDSCKPNRTSGVGVDKKPCSPKKKASPRPFQYVNGWPQFDFRYEYNFYNNYAVGKFDSPSVSPRTGVAPNRIKMQVQSVLKELRGEPQPLPTNRAQSPSHSRTIEWKNDRIIISPARGKEQVYDAAELEREAEARSQDHRSPSLVTFPRTPPPQNAALGAEGGGYPTEIVTDVDAIPSLEVHADASGKYMLRSYGQLQHHGVPECSDDDDDGMDSEPEPPKPDKWELYRQYRCNELPPAARKSSFSFLRRLFSSSTSLNQVGSSTSEIEQAESEAKKPPSRTNILSQIFGRK